MPQPVTPAAFSRLQLAAALIEYDNDPDNPDAPYHSARESAIFSHLRRHDPLSKPRRSTDYLGVQVPSEVESDPANRRSRGSIGALRNPFGNADDDDEPPDDEGVEVDLTSWGLGAFMEKDKGKGKGKGKTKSEVLPNPHPGGLARNTQSVAGDTSYGRGARSMSVGTLNDFGVGGAFLDSRQPDSLPPLQRRRASTHVLIETLPVQPPLHSVPFPSVSVSGRSSSPAPEEVLRSGSRASRLDLQTAHAHTQSNASLGSRALLNDPINPEDANLFAVRPASPDRASHFDSKVNRARTMSNASMGTVASKNMLAEENPFSVRPPSLSRSSRFDPKVHARTMSVNSMGTRALLDNDVDAESRHDRPLSTLELLRPKVLVMPSPLQSAAAPPPPPPVIRPRNGFQTSTDGPPLPPGARSARPSTQSGLAPIPIASNSFTPNPRASLSLSQLAFRNTLVVGGQRDIAYSDIDRHLPRAVKDGEQAQFEEEEQEESPVPSSVPLPPVPPPTEIEIRRAAGKLYGRSLIDNLEHRKLEMKQKARTFRGDNRPSMMVRGQIRSPNTLIDPETLGARPPSQNLNKKAPPLSRRNSGSAGPLLDLNGEKPPMLGASASTSDLPKSRSVFGVDTLWDREMAKLKEIEAQEKAEVEKRKRREREGAERRERSNKKKSKSKGKDMDFTPEHEVSPSQDVLESRVPLEPPTLPVIQKPILRRASVADDEEESESECDGDDVPLGQAIGRAIDRATDNWVAESSDEDERPRRTIGVGPRYSSATKSPAPRIPPLSDGEGDDSDEDLPLTAAAERIAKRTQIPHPSLVDDDEDEDKPLAAVLSESKLPLSQSKLSLPNLSFGNLSGGGRSTNDDDDDEQPLGLRASRLPPMGFQASLAFTGGDDDDDKPLAFHPEQQRRTQNQILAQVQQQQQMVMQTQMQNSFFFGAPAMMGSGFFGPPMGVPPMMMGMPVPPPSPPPVHDTAKFGRVDRWRHDVAVEGER
ncbi:hypothetical protein PAXRUDRAFT_750867 [Paxillus rubicundulus Ve08.2h10]|uniref:Uncharacterized protein n=1 Tax=Paxillus rubicundulus Ve08.2h10 TaxID=930991 RepID=A0A0D0E7Q6_9AGAM|nr:hypothetical protein PAXRUDRAFT_750867 [Paxillus rubicundulus Ve08.2h10]